MHALIEVRYGEDIDISLVEHTALFAMKQLGLPDNAEVSVVFVDDDEMADMNFRYRGIEGPTDVLSFECDNLDDDFPSCEGSDTVYSLGDIAIAPDVARRQAHAYGNTFEQEIALLLIHGILHLDGYDHIDDADAEVMEAKQGDIMRRWEAGEAS